LQWITRQTKEQQSGTMMIKRWDKDVDQLLRRKPSNSCRRSDPYAADYQVGCDNQGTRDD
jgi:hypothetical protein